MRCFLFSAILIIAFACGGGKTDYHSKDKAHITDTTSTPNATNEKSSVNETNRANKIDAASEAGVAGADDYIDLITGFTCEKATVTDNGYLVIAIDADSDSGYDMLASQFLDEAKREGVSGLKGVLIVDVKNAKFEQGSVVGKRIGKAYE